MKAHKQKDFECTPVQVHFLKKFIKAWRKQNAKLNSLEWSASLKVYESELKMLEALMQSVQEAFWKCTKSYNSKDNCRLVRDISFFESFVSAFEKKHGNVTKGEMIQL